MSTELTDQILRVIARHTPFSYKDLKAEYIGSFDDLIDALEHSIKQNTTLPDAYIWILAVKD